MLRYVYGISSGAALLLYAYLAFTGWELGTEPREQGLGDVRSGHAGYSSFHFWHAGPHGGK